jgi:hypothetical protein
MTEPTQDQSDPAAVTLDDLAAALQSADGKTPEEVLGSFIPDRTTLFGRALVKLTAGHEIFLQKIRHPLATRAAEWGEHDLLIALYVFTRPSRTLFDELAAGIFEDGVFALLDEIPFGEIENAAALMIKHWVDAKITALPMKAPATPGGSPQKKTAALGGS